MTTPMVAEREKSSARTWCADGEPELTNAAIERTIKDAGANASLQRLADLFHVARMSAGLYRRRAQDAHMTAIDLYPPQVEGLRTLGTSGAERGHWASPPIDRQDEHWPQWRVTLYERWARQCAAIDRGMGADDAEEASLAADALMDGLAHRVETMPIANLADATAKLAVAKYSYAGADEDAFMRLIERLETELRVLEKAAA
ncbi:MAG: hypothetical protein ACHP7N_00320 [Caulobacterales bacterium]